MWFGMGRENCGSQRSGKKCGSEWGEKIVAQNGVRKMWLAMEWKQYGSRLYSDIKQNGIFSRKKKHFDKMYVV
jgi:hypothetical protein